MEISILIQNKGKRRSIQKKKKQKSIDSWYLSYLPTVCAI